MSIKATFTLGKFVMISSIVMLIMIIPFSILMTIFWNNFWVNTLTYSLFAIFTLIYVVFDLSVIFKTSQFLDLNDNSLLKTNITLLFGFRLLVDFVTIFWYVISFLQRTR